MGTLQRKPMMLQALAVILCSALGNVRCRTMKDIDSRSFISGYNATQRQQLERSNSSTGRSLLATEMWNPIDDCWRNDPEWEKNRKNLADCALGFGSGTVGGRDGEIYVVTDSGDGAIDPAPGTLRYGVTQLYPLWITFDKDMTITLENELIVTSDKTIDGRGAQVHIAYGPCITIQDVSNVIIHGLHIHDCTPGRPGRVRSSTNHVGYRQGSDGDAISVFGSHSVWIDHNSFSSCYDGLIDVIHGSTAVTISNNVFTYHEKVMLLGHNDDYGDDKNLKVTIAYNRFGPGCVQRMPRCRLGYFHIVNNDYVGWEMYAIGGSANPTIISEGNRFSASNNRDAKEVTKRDCSGGWSSWNWRSINDIFENGAYFVQSGSVTPLYDQSLHYTYIYAPGMTSSAGTLSCQVGKPC